MQAVHNRLNFLQLPNIIAEVTGGLGGYTVGLIGQYLGNSPLPPAIASIDEVMPIPPRELENDDPNNSK